MVENVPSQVSLRDPVVVISVQQSPVLVPSSLVKLYFRELPVPVCTFNLYDEFVSAVRSPEEGRILKLREVI